LGKHFLNTTDDYHKHKLDSLGWEITLSIMLENPGSPCRSILKRGDSFGNLLYDFLGTIIPMKRIRNITEIGGGYGYLMRDFLRRNSNLCATMIDLSPFLLEQQRDTLKEFDVHFILGDFFEMNDSVLSSIDLVMLNEVIGDFPTACDVPRDELLERPEPVDDLLIEVARIYNSYRMNPPLKERFTLNLGGVQAIEKLCGARIPYIYISEHSCEASTPASLARLLEHNVTGEPERIRLRCHDEYTIRFSDLEKVASSFGYTSLRGQYIDFIEPIIDDEVTFILCLASSRIDRHEIINQFVEDLVKYEYLILSLPSDDQKMIKRI
jgi:hypothetical protein